jgi:5-(carboxyamino)imidazole ribonucleotide synthase
MMRARGEDGRGTVLDPVENRHRNHILDLTLAPARVPPAVAGQARRNVARVAEALDLVGVVALEMFLLPDGTLLGNEIAPRPHNSGHWTLEACLASQFEQHVRSVAGLPLADAARHHDAVMRNLVGPEGLARWDGLLARRDLAPHLYGKLEARPGRKLGHATRLLPPGALAGLADEAALAGL